MATEEAETISLNASVVPPESQNSPQIPNPQDAHLQSNQNPLQPDPLTLNPDTDSASAPNPNTSTTKWPGWPGDCVFRLIVSVLKVGSIIGRKGDLIRKMCDETRAHIRVLDAPVGTPDRIRKSQFANDLETTKRICSGRGEWIIQENDSEDKNHVEQESEDKDSEKDRPDLMPYVVDVSYDERLLLWHIATELLYNIETSDHVSKERLFSKILLDYMLYLLIVQPGMMTSVAGIGKIRYRDTCEEAERFIKRRSLGSKNLKAACEKILDVNIEVKPIDMKGDRSKSVL